MILAVDNQISLRVVEKLKIHYKVVIWAGNDPDEVWLEKALDLGADVFISPDLDIPNILEKIAPYATWIDVPQHLSKEKQFDYLISALKKVA